MCSTRLVQRWQYFRQWLFSVRQTSTLPAGKPSSKVWKFHQGVCEVLRQMRRLLRHSIRPTKLRRSGLADDFLCTWALSDTWCCSTPKHGEHFAFVEYGYLFWAHIQIKQQTHFVIANPQRNMIGSLGKWTVSIRLLMFQEVSFQSFPRLFPQ